MRSIALFFVIALVPAAALTAHAKTVTAQGTSNGTSAAGVAGPVAAARNSSPSQSASRTDQSASRHPGKKALKKAKVTPPPAMHDPN